MYAKTKTAFAYTSRMGTASAPPFENVGAKAFAALSIAYWVGTMGMLTPEAMVAQRRPTSSADVQYRLPAKAATDAAQTAAIALRPTSVQDLARIREVLKPTMLELANFFGVSRQAVYDWQNGAQPVEQKGEMLAELARAADVFGTSGLTVNTQTLRRKVVGGATLLDAIFTDGNAVQLAQSLVGTLQREDIQRQRLAQQLACRKRSPFNTADYGAPSLSEKT